MDFQELQYHLGSAVSVDHLEGESYFARNCISGKTCVIEELPVYSGLLGGSIIGGVVRDMLDGDLFD